MLSEARQKKIMEKLNRAQKCSILGPQNLGSRGVWDPDPPDPRLYKCGGGSKGACAPVRTKLFLISCSFWGNLANLYVSVPPQGWRPPGGEFWIRLCTWSVCECSLSS